MEQPSPATAAARIGPGGVLAVLLALAAASGAGLAHEIPESVTVRAFIRPEGTTLRILVRVPLEAMRDFDFPRTDSGALDVAASRELLPDVARTWIVPGIRLYENEAPLPLPRLVDVRLALPSDPSFGSYEEALAHLRSPGLDGDVELAPAQALLDAHLVVPIDSATSRFSLESELSRLGIRTTTVLRFLPADGPERAFRYRGDPGRVPLDPAWYQAALRFVRLGFLHILDGTDHLLFLLALVIPFRRVRPLVVIVTSFTVAHSLTLGAAALGLTPSALWFPALVETAIAASIVLMALENVLGAGLRRRWLLAFGFGLLHGFGFSFALRDSLQFAGDHLLGSLLAFNVGVELGQLLVLAVLLPALALGFDRLVPRRTGTLVLSILVAHTAWHWMTARGTELRQYRFELPAPDAFLLAEAMRWTMLGLVAAGALWGLATLLRRSGLPLEDPSAGN